MKRKTKKENEEDKTEESKFIDPDIAEKDREKDTDEAYKKYKGSEKQEELKILPQYISPQVFIDELRQFVSKGLQNEDEDVIYFLRALSNVSDSMVMRTYKTLFNAVYEAVFMKKYKHKRSDIEKWLKGTTADINNLIDVFKQCGIYVSAPEPNTYQVTDFFRDLITYERTPKGIPFSKENFKGFVFFIVLSNVPGAGKRIFRWIAKALTAGVMRAEREKEVDEEGEALILRRFFTRVALEEQIPEKRTRDLMFDVSGRKEPLFDDYIKKNDEFYIKTKSPVVKVILRNIERVREKERKRSDK